MPERRDADHAPRPAAMTWRRRSIHALLVLAVVAAALGLIELLAAGVFRVAGLQPTPAPVVPHPFHPYLGWENRPSYTYSGDLADGLHAWSIRTDSLGQALTPHAAFPHPDVRVVFLGGSAVFGVGQTDNAFTVPAVVERELNRRTGLRVEVHNLAVNGYTSFQEALALERYFSGHPADVVVSVSGYNDAFAAAVESGEEFGMLLHRVDPHTRLLRSVEAGDLSLLPVAGRSLMQALRRHSRAIDLMGKVADRAFPARPDTPWANVPPPDRAEVVRRARCVLTNYAVADAVARSHGARYFLFLQPVAITRARLTDGETRAMSTLNERLMERVLPVVRIFYPALSAGEKAFAFRDISRCLDEFPGSAFADECHYLNDAVPVVADRICTAIEGAVVDASRSHHSAVRP
jgi:hypothetical protein